MSQNTYSLSLSLDLKPGRRWRQWLLIALLVLLIHFLVFLTRVDWQGVKAPPQVEVQQVDPQKLEEIRRKWREQEKSILMDKNQPKSDKAPDDARYMSDKNIRVEKEQRARDHVITPHVGAPTQNQTQKKEKAQPQARAKPQTRGLPKIGNLGIPFHLGEKPQEQKEAPEHQASATTPGGEQYIPDKNLPVGSENILNAEESVYYSFYARLYNAIGPLWASRLRELAPETRVQPGDYTTAVDVVLDREGNLVEVRVLQGSRVREFDEAVNTSWRKIGKFPNPPSGLVKEDGHVHTGWNFTVQVGGGSGMMLMPPERTY